MDNPRLQALRVLMSVDKNKAYANLALPKDSEQGLSGVDKALLIQLVYGTLSRQITLDYVLNQHLKQPLDTMPVPVRNILRVGAFQLLFLDRIPARAAVDESVKLAHKFGHRGTVGLVNAVLRKVAANTDINWPSKDTDLIHYLSVRYAHPPFLVARYLQQFGTEETEQMLKSNNEAPKFTIRVNTLRTDVTSLTTKFKELGIDVEPGLYVPEVLYLSKAPSFEGDAFLQGYYIVQGEASALCAHFLDPQPGETVVDLCAAPGGKTTHIAELMQDTGVVYAFDINPKRLGLVRQNAQRLRLTSIRTVSAPAQEAQSTLKQADRVLLDAPCSGFGVIRHKPDMRLHRSEASIAELAQLQRELIVKAADLVKPGGTLVYSVCTTEPEETTEIVEWLLSNRADFGVAEPPKIVGTRQRKDGVGFLFLPHRDGIDGFYIASFIRAGK